MKTKSFASLVYTLNKDKNLKIDDVINIKKRKNKDRKSQPTSLSEDSRKEFIELTKNFFLIPKIQNKITDNH